MRKRVSVLLVLMLVFLALVPSGFAGGEETAPRVERNKDVLDIGPWLRFRENDEDISKQIDEQIRQAAAKIDFDEATQGEEDGAESTFTYDGGTKWFLALDTIYGYYVKTYTLRSVGEDVEIWVADDISYLPDDPRDDPVITQGQVDLLRDEFDSNIYPTDTNFFGMPDAHDGSLAVLDDILGLPEDYYMSEEGQRNIILVDNIGDESYHDPDYPLFIAGFYSSEFESYMDRNIISLDTNSWETRLESTFFGTTAHEYQHLIHDDNDPYETTWLNEGMSDFAEYLCGYGHPESHVGDFLQYPENSLVDWDEHGNLDPPETLADYGQAYLLQLYLHDQFGADFTREVAMSPISGFESINAVLDNFGAGIDFEEVFRRFCVAVAIDAPMPERGIYEFTSIDLFADPFTGLSYQSALEYDKDGVPAWGGDYKRLTNMKNIKGVIFDGIDFMPTPWLEVDESPDGGGAALMVIGLIVWGIKYTHRKGKVVLNTVIMGLTVILIGYSSFAMVIIRSAADPPMDQNNPDNVFDLLYYLNREQYGDKPLFYGQSYDAPAISNKKTKPVYIKKDGRYEIADYKIEVEFDPRFTSLFPRMYSSDKKHIEEYNKWVNISDKKISVRNGAGQVEKRVQPSFANNIAFFVKYQIGHMYFRYFMWNFSGRQNDIQGHGNVLKGNWISGIPFVDDARLGDQDQVPEHLKDNPGRNRYFMLPLILGLIGLIFHYKQNKQDFTVVLMLYVLTGIAIVVYLNQYPLQPRERDYAFAGSYYAFAIWIGLGVAGLISFLSKKAPKSISAILVTVITLALVPGIMASENWDDHDRSGRYTARDLAYNYLNSCEKNAILFTNGDNDTFPLWYAQEVEGIRTDIKVCNLSYLRAAWYIDQMSRKSYEAERMPFSLTYDKYHKGVRDILPIYDRVGKAADVRDVVDFIASDDAKTKIKSPFVANKMINYIPSKEYKLKIDPENVINKGIVSEKYRDRIVDEMQWNFNQGYLYKDGLMLLDLLATNNWERPVYWAMTVTSTKYFNLQKYFKVDGLTYQLVPVEAEKERFHSGEVDSELMYDNIMNKFRWGGIEDGDIYFDENNTRMFSNLRSSFGRLAEKLIEEGKTDSALLVLDRCMDLFPDHKIPFNSTLLSVISAYYHAGAIEKANSLVEELSGKMFIELDYYFNLKPNMVVGTKDITMEKQTNLYILQELYRITGSNNQQELNSQIEQKFMQYIEQFN